MSATCNRTLAVEEAYTAVLDEVSDHTEESLARRFRNLVSSRIAKYLSSST